jgi:hypothetical protein
MLGDVITTIPGAITQCIEQWRLDDEWQTTLGALVGQATWRQRVANSPNLLLRLIALG